MNKNEKLKKERKKKILKEDRKRKSERKIKNKNGLAAILHTFFYIPSLGPSICART